MISNNLATFVTLIVTTMNTRLKQFLAAENITQAQFADTLEVVRASVSHILSGRNNPGYDFIKALMLKYPRLNIEWLIFGKGKMYKDMEDMHSTSLFDDDAQVIDAESEPEMQPIVEMTENSGCTTSTHKPQSADTQRKVSKIIILYNDGTFQEM